MDDFGTQVNVKDNVRCIYTVSQKIIPNIFIYNSRKHWRIFIIFGRNVTEKASNHMLLHFPTSPN